MRLLRTVVMVVAVCAATVVTIWTLVTRFVLSSSSSASAPPADGDFAEALAGVDRIARAGEVIEIAVIIAVPWLVAALAIGASERDHRRRRELLLSESTRALLGEGSDDDPTRIRRDRGPDPLRPFDGEVPPRSW
ncbi:MAG TPA: hypothetical protein VGC57_01775 [Cellulomonas sp.]